MIRDNREYRNIPLLVEKREEGEDRSYIVEGYASTFDEYELWNDGTDSFCERIDKGAFDSCDMSDVIFNLDHSGRVYARTRNGSVELNADDHGLYSKIDLSRSSSARQTLEDIECGNYDRMSFAFTVDAEAFEHDSTAHKYLRIIKRIGKLFDISAVSFPANPNTEIGVSARSAFDGFIEEEKRLELAKAEEARRLDEKREEIRKILEGGKE